MSQSPTRNIASTKNNAANVKTSVGVRNEIWAKNRHFSTCFYRGNRVTIYLRYSINRHYLTCANHVNYWLAKTMGDRMGSAKQRPAHVPAENVYSRIHWMVIVTYVAATGAVALLILGAG